MAKRERTPYLISRIQRDLRARGWNQTALREAADGLSVGTLSRFMRGEVQTPQTARKIANALGRDLSEYVNDAATQ